MKEEIKLALKQILELDLKAAYEIESSLESFKTDSDMKAESKYDTRGIEAGYLASAHARRIQELERDLLICGKMDFSKTLNNEEITLGSIIEIKMNELIKKYFLSMICGGAILNQFSSPIQVLSIISPLGKEVLGLRVGDEFELSLKGKTQTYQIISLS